LRRVHLSNIILAFLRLFKNNAGKFGAFEFAVSNNVNIMHASGVMILLQVFRWVIMVFAIVMGNNWGEASVSLQHTLAWYGEN
jgi:hypothetical protein